MITLRTLMILNLHGQRLLCSAIARELGLERKMVRRTIARGLEAKRTSLSPLIDAFVPHLQERGTAYPGMTGQRLWRDQRERSYAGGYTAVTNLLHELRPIPLPAFEIRCEAPACRRSCAVTWRPSRRSAAFPTARARHPMRGQRSLCGGEASPRGALPIAAATSRS